MRTRNGVLQQPGNQIYFGAGQGLRNWTPSFGAFRKSVECGGVDSRDDCLAIQFDPCDAESFPGLFEINRGGRVDLFRSVPRFAQFRREGHGKTTGMGGADQLLRIRPRCVFETRAERVTPFKGPTSKPNFPLAVGQATFPNCFCFSCRHIPPFRCGGNRIAVLPKQPFKSSNWNAGMSNRPQY
jgi:hypothetical protein